MSPRAMRRSGPNSRDHGAVRPGQRPGAGAPQAPEEAEARSRLSVASFSREQEFEADQIGIKTIAGRATTPTPRRGS